MDRTFSSDIEKTSEKASIHDRASTALLLSVDELTFRIPPASCFCVKSSSLRSLASFSPRQARATWLSLTRLPKRA